MRSVSVFVNYEENTFRLILNCIEMFVSATGIKVFLGSKTMGALMNADMACSNVSHRNEEMEHVVPQK